MEFLKPYECGICKQIFLTPHELISHFEVFHSNRGHFSFFSNSVSAATTNFRYNPNINRNLRIISDPVIPTRNHFDGYLDGRERFHKGLPPSSAAIPTQKNSLFAAKEVEADESLSYNIIGRYLYAAASLPARETNSGQHCDRVQRSQLEFHRLVIKTVKLSSPIKLIK